MKALMLLIIATISALSLHANGQIIGTASFSQDGLKYLSQDKALLEFVTNSLDVQEVGKCQLLVADAVPAPAKNIPPYEFMARLRGSSGPYNLRLILPMQIGTGTNNAFPPPEVIIESRQEGK